MNTIEIGNRIKAAREEKGLTQEELGIRLGLNKSTIQRYEAGKILRIKLPVLESIAIELNVNPEYLALKTDDPSPKHSSHIIDSNATILPQDNVHIIPIYESVSAGFGAYADDYVVDYMPLYIVSEEEAKNTMCIVVSGDSMYPKIENGDKIQVLRQDWAEDGQVVVALIDGENGVVKKIKYSDDKITLVSFNPEYQPREFVGAERDRIRILGIVKTVIKSL